MVALSPHQIEALGKLSNAKILRGGVGTGKSRIALAYFAVKVCKGRIKINDAGEFSPPENPMPLYIITTAKKRDEYEWDSELANFLMTVGTQPDWLGRHIIVDSWNNIAKYAKVEDAFFIFDEQRLVGSGKWVKAFYRIARKNKWIILTATPGDDWEDYIPVFVANGFYNTRTQFLTTHAVYNTYANYPKIDRWVDTLRLHEFRNRVLVEVDFETHASRHILTVPTTYDEFKWSKVFKDRWDPFEDEPIADAAGWFRLMRKVVNSDPSKVLEVGKLVKKHPRLIIFYNFNYELHALRDYLDGQGLTYAEWNGHKHQEIPEGDNWVYLVQYMAGSEGWNCVLTDAMAFYSLTYSHKQFEQAQGRIDRLNTPFLDLYYYVLRSDTYIDKAIWKAIQRKRNFNERSASKSAKWGDPKDVHDASSEAGT